MVGIAQTLVAHERARGHAAREGYELLRGQSAAVMEAAAQPAIADTLDAVETTTRERTASILAERNLVLRFAVARGDPAAELIAAAHDNRATAIVVGGRSHGLISGLALGSVAQKLVRHSPVSVLVVRDGHAHPLEPTSTGTLSTATG